jgi:hypothetical protein
MSGFGRISSQNLAQDASEEIILVHRPTVSAIFQTTPSVATQNRHSEDLSGCLPDSRLLLQQRQRIIRRHNR